MIAASAANDGYLTSTDWSTFSSGVSKWTQNASGDIHRASRVGIGNTAPDYPLHVRSATSAAAFDNGGFFGIYLDPANLTIGIGNPDNNDRYGFMYADAFGITLGSEAQRTGINTYNTGPQAHLHVNAPNTAGNDIVETLRLSREDSNSAASNGIGAALTFNLETTTNEASREAARIAGVWDDAANNSKDGSLIFYTMGPNAASADVTTTEKMRITSSGQVGIGKTPSYALDVSGDINLTAGYNFKINGVNIPTSTTLASGTTTGLLTSADWTTFSSGSSKWTQDASGDISRASNVAINGSFLATGDSTDITPASGAGARMMWIPSKSAFRVGTVDGTQWNHANIGQDSIAMGLNAIAQGSSSFVVGPNAESTESDSITMGNYANSYSTRSVAIGSLASVTAGAAYGVSIGAGTVASGAYAVAIGATDHSASSRSAIASRDNSLAIGQFVTANNTRSAVIGSGRTNGSRLVNSVADSLMLGANSTVPSITIESAPSAGVAGFVGIGGVTNPGYALDVSGDINLTGGNFKINGVNLPTSTTLASGTTTGLLTSADWTTFSSGSSKWTQNASGDIYRATGFVGLGISLPLTPLHIHNAAPIIRLNDSDFATGYNTIMEEDGNNFSILKNTAAGSATFDFDPRPNNGTSSASLRIFRNTNTTGVRSMQFMRGDNTTTVDAQIGAHTAPTYFGMGGGAVGVRMSSPSYALDVSGDVNVTGNFKINGVNIPTSTTLASGTTTGLLTSADWTTFNSAGSKWTNTVSGDIYRSTNVGIGTTAPTSKLHVVQASSVDNSAVVAQQIQLTESGNLPTGDGANAYSKTGQSVALTYSGTNAKYDAHSLIATSSTSTFSGAQTHFFGAVSAVGVQGHATLQGGTINGTDSASLFTGLRGLASGNASTYLVNFIGIDAQAVGSGSSASNTGVKAWASGAAISNIGVGVSASGASSSNAGITVAVSGAATTNTGLSMSISGATNNRAIEITSPAAGANNYAIYSSAAAKSYFAGQVAIGKTTPSYALDVSGDINLTGGAFRVNGTAIGTGDASTTLGLGQFATTSSAQLAAVISNETGSGNLVFSASPTFTGTPAAPTAAVNTNTTQLATTAYVVGQAGSSSPLMNNTVAVGTSLRYSREDHVHPVDTSRAPAAGSGSITTVGTITSGTWNGTAIGVQYGGTGAATHTAGSLLVGAGTSAITSLAGGSAGNVVYATGASTWASGTKDAAGIVDKTTAQTIAGDKTFSGTTTTFSGGVVLYKASTSNATGIIDFGTGNIQHTTQNCGAYNLYNVKEGGSYTFIVKGGTPATCSFTIYSGSGTGQYAGGNVKMPTDHGETTNAKHTFYSIIVAGGDVYITWMPGM